MSNDNHGRADLDSGAFPHLRRPPQPGDVLDGTYRIDRVLGYGAVGVVCAAWHLHVQRPCAVKYLHPQLVSNPELRARFRREAQSAFQLGHPHIVAITDFRDEPGAWPYIVMELVSGEMLRTRLERGPLPPPLAVRLMMELCDALHTAHRRGVIHRDLKPENLFLTSHEGSDEVFLKVLDFGLSKILDESDITETGRLLGSPSYMSPEQARGDSHLVDARSDIFAVGALLYECLTSYKLFEAQSFEIKRQLIMEGKLPPLKLVQRGMPEALEAIVRCACAKLPDDRFPTAAAMMEALSRVYPEEVLSSRRDFSSRSHSTVPSSSSSGGQRGQSGPVVGQAGLPAGNEPPRRVRTSTGAMAVSGELGDPREASPRSQVAFSLGRVEGQGRPATPLPQPSPYSSAAQRAVQAATPQPAAVPRPRAHPQPAAPASFVPPAQGAQMPDPLADMLRPDVGMESTLPGTPLGRTPIGAPMGMDEQAPAPPGASAAVEPSGPAPMAPPRWRTGLFVAVICVGIAFGAAVALLAYRMSLMQQQGEVTPIAQPLPVPTVAQPVPKPAHNPPAAEPTPAPVLKVTEPEPAPRHEHRDHGVRGPKPAKPLADQLTIGSVDEVMHMARGSIVRCFPADVTIPQRVTIEMIVLPSGRVREATTNVGEEQSNCAELVLRGLRFPPFRNEQPISVHYELVNLNHQTQ